MQKKYTKITIMILWALTGSLIGVGAAIILQRPVNVEQDAIMLGDVIPDMVVHDESEDRGVLDHARLGKSARRVGVYPVKTIAGSYLTARFAANNNDFSRAAQAIEHVKRHTPQSNHILERAFPAFLAAGQVEQAIDAANNITETEPLIDHIAQTLLLIEALKTDDLETAREFADGFDTIGFGEYLRPVFRAWVAYAEQSPEDGLAILESARRKTPNYALLFDAHEAMLLAEIGEMDNAQKLFERILGEHLTVRTLDMARHFFVKAEQPERLKYWVDRFHALTGPHLYQPINDLPVKALDRNTVEEHDDLDDTESDTIATPNRKPDIGTPSPQAQLRSARAADGIGEALYDLATVLRDEQSLKLSQLYARIVEYINSSHELKTLLMGDLASDMGKVLTAHLYYSSLDPKSAFYLMAQTRIASALAQHGQLERGIQRLVDSITKHETDDDITMLLLKQAGDLYRSQEYFAEALPFYDRLITMIDTPKPPHWEAFFARGICLERTGEWEKAEHDLKQALELRPNDPYVLNYLGYTWADHGVNIDKALDYIRRAVSQRPYDGAIVDSMGWVLFRLGAYEQAIIFLERAVALEPDDPVINDHLGDALWMAGRHDEAKYQWQRALTMIEEGVSVEPGFTETVMMKLTTGLTDVTPVAELDSLSDEAQEILKKMRAIEL